MATTPGDIVMMVNEMGGMRVLDPLLENRQRFLSFVRRRVGNRQVAEDILQAAYARAVEKAGTCATRSRTGIGGQMSN